MKIIFDYEKEISQKTLKRPTSKRSKNIEAKRIQSYMDYSMFIQRAEDNTF